MPRRKISEIEAKTLIKAVNKWVTEGFKHSQARAKYAEATKTPVSTVISRVQAAKDLYGLELVIEAENQVQIDFSAPRVSTETLLNELKGGKKKTLAELAAAAKSSIGEVLDVIDDLKARGTNIQRFGDSYQILSQHRESFLGGPTFELLSRPDNTFIFGGCGDLHAGSKYTRWDVRDDLYRRYEAAGAQCVFDTGNWIEGESHFNKYDIETSGLNGQCKQLAERHPNNGLKTYAVWGDDHEGWYAQREGMDVGRYNESIMRDAGHDWTNIGFMEAHILLKNANTGTTATLAVVHPGGGSAYALSYSIQKIVESYEGGEKPNVALYGHYHKLWAGVIRNVWVAQTGCAQDQTPFMRKKRLEAHVGGTLIQLEQDPETGAILSMTPQIIRYFNEGWYAGRWSKHDAVTLAPRSIKAI